MHIKNNVSVNMLYLSNYASLLATKIQWENKQTNKAEFDNNPKNLFSKSDDNIMQKSDTC